MARSIEERLAAVHDFRNRGDASVETIANKHSVSPHSLYAWARLAKEGKLFDPQKEQVNGEAPRRQYSDELREKVIEAYLNRGSRSVAEVGAEFGVSAQRVHVWAQSAKQNGASSAIVKRSEDALPLADQLALLAAPRRSSSGRDKRIMALAMAVRALADVIIEEG